MASFKVAPFSWTEHSGEHGDLEEDDHQVRRRLQPRQTPGDLQGVGSQDSRGVLHTGEGVLQKAFDP